jgi:hypothetical protein
VQAVEGAGQAVDAGRTEGPVRDPALTVGEVTLEDLGLGACLRSTPQTELVTADTGCLPLSEEFSGRFQSLGLVSLLLFLPALVGLFWGAPLVARELEHGTHRLVWTQGVTRLRWATVKLGLVGGGVVLVAVHLIRRRTA